ncbi:unnamed protein product [Diabrotica balteata]|uniref:Uncharacterized protein n=1 Tax=Diabrotica balteata TaxID=107213 RepID=A0A9N9T309_DIABA|nr:unnamed protein product [Diabrotica balteata]
MYKVYQKFLKGVQLKVQAQEGYFSQLNIEDVPLTSKSISQLKVQAQEGYCSQLNIEDVPSTSKSIGVNTNPTNEALELANSKEKIKLLNEQVAELLQIKSAVGKLFTPKQLKRLQNPKIRTVINEKLNKLLNTSGYPDNNIIIYFM